MAGMDATTAHRWAPTIAKLLPTFRAMLLARVAAPDAMVH
jgi:hypothetical protein